MKLIFIAIFIPVIMFGCYGEYKPDKPTTVPENAIWVGGLDGGVWLKIDKVISSNTIKAEIYFESGRKRASGIFKSDDCFPDDIQLSVDLLYEWANFSDGVSINFRYEDSYCSMYLL